MTIMAPPTNDKPRVKKKYEIIGSVRVFDTDRIMPDPKNPRKRFRKIRQLSESIKATGQTTPGKVTILSDNPDYDVKLVDGERRLMACKMAEVPFEAYVVEERQSTLTPLQRLKQALAANFNQEPHDRIEVAYGLQELLEQSQKEGQRLSHKELGQIFGGKSDCWVSQHLSLLRLSPKVQEMMIPPDDESEDAEAEAEAQRIPSAEPDEKISRARQRRKHIPFVIGLLLVNLSQAVQEEKAEKILREGMSLVKARRLIFKEVGTLVRKHQGRTRSPHEAVEVFGNKTLTIWDMLGIYRDMTYQRLENMFSQCSPAETQKHIEMLLDIASSAQGLADSLKTFYKKKMRCGVVQARR